MVLAAGDLDYSYGASAGTGGSWGSETAVGTVQDAVDGMATTGWDSWGHYEPLRASGGHGVPWVSLPTARVGTRTKKTETENAAKMSMNRTGNIDKTGAKAAAACIAKGEIQDDEFLANFKRTISEYKVWEQRWKKKNAGQELRYSDHPMIRKFKGQVQRACNNYKEGKNWRYDLPTPVEAVAIRYLGAARGVNDGALRKLHFLQCRLLHEIGPGDPTASEPERMDEMEDSSTEIQAAQDSDYTIRQIAAAIKTLAKTVAKLEEKCQTWTSAVDGLEGSLNDLADRVLRAERDLINARIDLAKINKAAASGTADATSAGMKLIHKTPVAASPLPEPAPNTPTRSNGTKGEPSTACPKRKMAAPAAATGSAKKPRNDDTGDLLADLTSTS
ncbi:hypothetical protein VTK73DRAFT_3680 [Phialemonium thermophilum]|uniref:Uncharacterized protein n=1 Tax=Phialemonium thermophilum TaxID=223376 RepID=A0ABR3VFX4_9PEZI